VLRESPTRRQSFTVNDLAARWDCDPQLIYRRIRRGHIRAFKVGNLWRIPVDEVDRIEATEPVVDEDGQPTDDIEASIAALVAQAPPLTDEQRIRLSAWLLTGNGGAA
jgi:excisionase family DNA binding protein